MASISIRNVRKSFGRLEVVHGVDLDIRPGEFVVILGPSGCGKSTLLRMIAGLEEISGGEIAIDGKVVNRLEPRERGCAMVFQNYALYPHMSVAGNIGYSLKVAGIPKAERMERVRAIARALELEPLLDRKPAALSGGQRQRVAMGRAMIREPKVFLFDEPLSNLDARLRVQMRVEIRRLHQRLRTTSVFVTHDQVEAMTLADKLVVMNAGQIEQVGSPAEVYHEPSSRYVAGFMGSPPMNFLDATVAGRHAVRLADGTMLAVPISLPIGESGAPVTIGFRPETVAAVPVGTQGGIAFAVDLVEELGAGRLARGRLGGSEIIAALPPDAQVRAGTTLALAIPPESFHAFASDGRRLAAREQTLAAE